MPKLVLPHLRRYLFAWLAFPLLVGIVASLLVASLYSLQFALALALGGGIWLLPQIYLAWRLFYRFDPQAKSFVKILYRGEALKLAFVALAMVIAVKYLTVHIGALLTGYFLLQLSFWLTPLFLSK